VVLGGDWFWFFDALMKITIVGAAGGEVTGSAYYVQTRQASLLVDCGLFQGGKKAEALNRAPTGPRQKLDAVLLTHGHLDHTGRLPLLSHRGHRLPVFATPATIDMTALILRDSARIQAGDAERENRKRERAGQPPIEPLYSPQHAEEIIQGLQPVPYGEPVRVAEGIQARFVEAGHMLGSASIELIVNEDGWEKKVVFSGDLGPKGSPILHDFKPLHAADLVFLESTYGDHDHRAFPETIDEFVSVVKDAVAHKGKILIPTFAVGRAQMLTVLMSWMFRKKHAKPFPLFLDSPMAIEATKLYFKHFRDNPELFDDLLLNYIRQKPIREDLKTLRATATAEQSKQINDCPGPCLIMAGAGMCNAGRILHHLKANLWKPETHVIIVGYQAYGSLGRRLVEGEKVVSIHGEKIAVKAKVHTLGGFSAHAGQTDLLSWFNNLAAAKPRVVLTHGEDGPREALAKLIWQKHRLKAAIPQMREAIAI
jgi:metallo-beta-lactamase family protein